MNVNTPEKVEAVEDAVEEADASDHDVNHQATKDAARPCQDLPLKSADLDLKGR